MKINKIKKIKKNKLSNRKSKKSKSSKKNNKGKKNKISKKYKRNKISKKNYRGGSLTELSTTQLTNLPTPSTLESPPLPSTNLPTPLSLESQSLQSTNNLQLTNLPTQSPSTNNLPIPLTNNLPTPSSSTQTSNPIQCLCQCANMSEEPSNCSCKCPYIPNENIISPEEEERIAAEEAAKEAAEEEERRAEEEREKLQKIKNLKKEINIIKNFPNWDTNKMLDSLDYITIDVFIDEAEKCKTLTELVYFCHFPDQIEYYATKQEPSALALTMTNNFFDSVSNILKNTHITNLTIAFGSLKFCIVKMAQLLKTNSVLENFSLCYNKFGDECAIALADALITNTTLKSLTFKEQQLSNESAAALAQALVHNNTLHSLILNKNSITLEGAILLINSCSINKTLTFINLEDNLIYEPQYNNLRLNLVKLNSDARKDNKLKLKIHWINFNE